MTTLVRWPADQVRHTMAWRTDVLKAWDGTEYRIALATVPRDRYELGIPLDDADVRQVRGWLLTDPAGTYEIPLRHERLLATSAVTVGTVAVGTTTLSDWAVVGQRVLVESLLDPDDYYTAAITVVAASLLTLDTLPPGGMTFPAELTAIAPLVSVLLENGQAIGRYQVNAGRWSLVGRAAAPRSSFGAGATLVTHDSLTVMDRMPRAAGLAQEQMAAGVEILDQGGAIATAWSRTVSDVRRSHTWQIANTAAERQWWKKFLGSVRGRQKPFLLPTWRHDLDLVSNPAGTSLIVEGPPTPDAPGYVTTYWPSLAHRRVQLLKSDGTVAYRTISAAVDNLDGTQTLTIATLTATVTRVSFLETVRLDTDEVTVDLVAAEYGDLELPCCVVQQ